MKVKVLFISPLMGKSSLPVINQRNKAGLDKSDSFLSSNVILNESELYHLNQFFQVHHKRINSVVDDDQNFDYDSFIDELDYDVRITNAIKVNFMS
jgi:hypothetical protein